MDQPASLTLLEDWYFVCKNPVGAYVQYVSTIGLEVMDLVLIIR